MYRHSKKVKISRESLQNTQAIKNFVSFKDNKVAQRNSNLNTVMLKV